MRLVSLKILGGLFPAEYDFAALTVIYSAHNGAGKTTLIRSILYALGYAIPSMKGFRFEKLEFQLTVVTDERKTCVLLRRGSVLILNAPAKSERFTLPYDQNKLHASLFGIESIMVLNNLLGAYYFDQEKGWTLLNRGKVIGNIRFAIEDFLIGLINRSSNAERERLASVTAELRKYQQMLSVAEYKEEIQANGDALACNAPVEEVSAEVGRLKNERKSLECELQRLKDIIKKNNSFEKYITSMRLRVRAKNGEVVPVTSATIIGFRDADCLVHAKKEEIQFRLSAIENKIGRLESAHTHTQDLFEVQTSAQKFDEDLVKLQIDKESVEGIVRKLKAERKRLMDAFHKVLMNESSIVSCGTKSILDYLEEFGLDRKYGEDIFTRDLKSLSGAILHRLVFAFRITYAKLVREQTGYLLPIIIDSPNGREVEKDLVRKMMEVLLRDFVDHQVIIATIFNDNFPAQKLIVLEKEGAVA